jgi:hypothetical protein
LIAGRTRGRKSETEIKTTKAAYGDKAWRMSSIYYFIMKVKAGETTDNQHNNSAKENQEDCQHCTAVAANVKGDRCITCKDITSSSGGVQWEGQSATSSVMTKGSPRSGSFN